MLSFLRHIDYELFSLINGCHNFWMDHLMWAFSQRLYWIPLYLLLVMFIIKKYRKASIFIILTLLITITLSDQFSVLIKESVMRLRPSHNPYFESTIHLVNGYKGGLYGFVSSHAANVTALVTFLFFIPVFKKKLYWYALALWAFLVSYSRIYLGVHYPSDIVGGIILGFLISCLTSYVLKIVYLNKNLILKK